MCAYAFCLSLTPCLFWYFINFNFIVSIKKLLIWKFFIYFIYQLDRRLAKWRHSDVQLRWYPVSFLNNNNMYPAIPSMFWKQNIKNNYLRNDLVKSFFVAFCCITFLNNQKTVGGLTKSDITFVLFEIFWWNLAAIRRNELPLSL